MALTDSTMLGWHTGEDEMHDLLKVPEQDNPTSMGLTPFGYFILGKATLLAVGALDEEGRPWTTLWGGEAGFAQPVGQSVIGLRTVVDEVHDPVLRLLVPSLGRETDVETEQRKPVAALSIDLATRSRLKISGEMMAGAVEQKSGQKGSKAVAEAEAQVIIAVKHSLGNCPKYLNAKRITRAAPTPLLLADTFPLNDRALGLLAKADLFFITSHHYGILGTNHRGGPPGFVRVLQNEPSTVVLVYPEYSGNRLYQTLGNLKVIPRAGLIIPDFDNGDALYLTCETDILIGKEATALLPRSNMAVKLSLTGVRFVAGALAFRGHSSSPSPYNPSVRYLTSERKPHDAVGSGGELVSAKLMTKTILTSTITRLGFKCENSELARSRKPGQYAVFNFENELSLGYSHMRNDDPKSLNDDFIRSFTVSSPVVGSMARNQFEITIRNVGKATDLLFNQQVRNHIEIPLKGFAGDFQMGSSGDGVLPFVAGGIGITPLLAHIPQIDLTNLRLFWTINAQDLGLVEDTFSSWPKLKPSTSLFITGIIDSLSSDYRHLLETTKAPGAEILTRRLTASDLTNHQSLSSTWYVCTGKPLRQSLLEWLKEKTVIYEDFDY